MSEQKLEVSEYPYCAYCGRVEDGHTHNGPDAPPGPRAVPMYHRCCGRIASSGHANGCKNAYYKPSQTDVSEQNEVDLPDLDEVKIREAFKTFNYKYFGDYELSEGQREAVYTVWTAAERLLKIEPELRAQIAALTVQVAAAKRDLDMEVARLLKAQDLQIEAAVQARNEAAYESLWRKQAERERDALKSELAALREGVTVTYRTDCGYVGEDGARSTGVYRYYHSSEADARAKERSWMEPRSTSFGQYVEVAEIITRERILDADGGEG